MSVDFSGICKADIDGHYRGDYFRQPSNLKSEYGLPASTRRLRAVIQHMNQEFSDVVRLKGHKFHIESFRKRSENVQAETTNNMGEGDEKDEEDDEVEEDEEDEKDEDNEDEEAGENCTPTSGDTDSSKIHSGPQKQSYFSTELPQEVSNDEAIAWVRRIITGARGRELPGSFNPQVIAELFWEQSSRWHPIVDTCKPSRARLLWVSL